MIGNPSVKRSWVYYQNVLYWKLTIKWRDYFVYRVSFSCKTNFWFSDSIEYQDRISLDRQTSKLSLTYRMMVFHENTSILCMISTRFYLNNIYLSIKIASFGKYKLAHYHLRTRWNEKLQFLYLLLETGTNTSGLLS